MSFNVYSILVFVFLTLVLYLEIRGYVKQKQVFKNLQQLMSEWGEKHSLSPEQWHYLTRGIKVTANPFSIVKLLIMIPFVPLLDISRTPVAIELEKKDPALYKKTLWEFNNALSYASPTLYLILMIEIQVTFIFWRILLAVVMVSVMLFTFLTSFISKKTNIKYSREINEKYDSVSLMQADLLYK